MVLQAKISASKTRWLTIALLRCAAIAAATGAAAQALAQTPAHVTAVRKAQQSAYAVKEATNGCPAVGTDMFGWPGAKVLKCVYSKGPKGKSLPGLAYMLDVPPETIARWIETACANQLPAVGACFATVLKCGHVNSGMMFPVSGNILEDMTPKPWQNYFFRNGMTVAIGGQANGTSTPIPIARQEELARMPDTEITSIPTGLTRYWRTLPKQFAARFPDAGAPIKLDSQPARQKWLDIARVEFLEALASPTNRLLEAWVAAHPVTLKTGTCPEDKQP